MQTDKFIIFLYISILFFLFAKPSFAYLDPGTGSYLFQLIIAGLLGGTIFFRSTAKKIKEFFKSKKSGGEKANKDR